MGFLYHILYGYVKTHRYFCSFRMFFQMKEVFNISLRPFYRRKFQVQQFKADAAREKHVPLVLIRRPQEDGQTMEEILHELGEEEAQCK